jgi:hypothetical protein
VILEISLSAGGKDHAVVTGDPMAVAVQLRDLVEVFGTWDVHLSWPIGAGWGGLTIPAGQGFDDAIKSAKVELEDLDLVFDDPAEEDMARLIVRNLYLAVILDTTPLVVEEIEEAERAGIDPGDYSEDAGARYDRYDELEEPETYN